MTFPWPYIKQIHTNTIQSNRGCCQENNDSFLIQIISSNACLFNLISPSSQFNKKPDHDFWHKKVRYKIDHDIWVIDNSSLLQFSCRGLILVTLLISQGTSLRLMDCNCMTKYTFLPLTTKPSVFQGIASFRVIKFHIYCTTKQL